ncbi:hypothetical protein UFOVP841_18 [uncultured Caudovirales phage]|uniref:NrS-1 polymerase-like helicase domain-containing protein n=1 Tax=uncultured Caudovirales phage TaxID=2100421 RepID=A0A6J5P413_9CAUD|nr:hypothetical protein UFOVP841_18 [uncultured Caudovirales phage]
MATRSLTRLRDERNKTNTEILGKEQLIARLPNPDSNEGLILRGQVAQLRELIDQLDDEIAKADVLEKKRTKKTNWASEQPLVDDAIDRNFMGYIAPIDQFIYCKDYGAGQSNVQFKMFHGSRIIRIMNKLTGSTISSRDPNEMIDYFENRGKTYLDITASFNTSKWNDQQVYNKMSIIRDQWLKPDYANADQYDQRFDILLNTVCGGKAENIEHLERWVAFKYLYPEKNANTPNIDLGGNPGGNGKGRFVEVLKTIFTPTCVIQAHKEELEKFNANWEMAVILYYDEPEEKELAASKLKQATGAEDMRIEKKGIDATMADRNYNFVFMSNNQQGVVKLSGGSDGGEDRRYSVINTNLVLFDELTQFGMNQRDALDWLNELAQQLVKDAAAVSQWLAHIILKHSAHTMTVLPALHGEDYQKRFETQKEPLTQAFDKIMPVFVKNGMIPQGLLTELCRVLTDNDKHKDHNVRDKFENYLRRNKVDCEVLERTRYNILWQGDEQKELQQKIIVVRGSKQREFEWSTISSKRYQNNPVTDALRIEHLTV